MRIGEAAAQSGINVETIRFYEREGLLGPTTRKTNAYRVYSPAHVERLAFIRHCRAMDIPLSEIRRLLSIADTPENDCDGINHMIEGHLVRVRVRLQALRVLERDLTKLRERCAAGHKARECGILQGLSAAAREVAPDKPHAKRHVVGA